MERVFHAGFLFLHFGFGRGADFNHGHAADQFGQPFLKFLAIVIGGGLFDLGADLFDAAFQFGALSCAVDDRGVVLVDGDLLGASEVFDFHVLQFVAHVFGNHLAAGEDGDVFQHGLAAIAEAGGFNGRHMQRAADLVDHQGGQRFAFDVFGDDEERAAHFGDLFEDRQQIFHSADFLFIDQDERVFQRDNHLVGIRDEIGGQVAAVELHAFHDLQFRFEPFGLFHSDDAFLADLVHRAGDDVADGFIVVGGDSADLGDFFLVLGGFAHFAELFDDGFHGLVDAAFHVHGIGACGDGFNAFAVNGLGQDGGGGGAVACYVAGLAGHFLDHLRAHVFKFVFEFDFLGDGDAVLCHGGRAKALVNNHIAAFGAEGYLHGIGQGVDALQDRFSCFFIVKKYFCSHCTDSSLYFLIFR